MEGVTGIRVNPYVPQERFALELLVRRLAVPSVRDGGPGKVQCAPARGSNDLHDRWVGGERTAEEEQRAQQAAEEQRARSGQDVLIETATEVDA